jgi:hypothetical protein
MVTKPFALDDKVYLLSGTGSHVKVREWTIKEFLKEVSREYRMKKRLFLTSLLVLFLAEGCMMFEKYMDGPRMTKDTLKAMMGNPDLVIIDVRYGKDWTDSDLKIRGAVREDPDAVNSWANKYPKDKTLVFYCA